MRGAGTLTVHSVKESPVSTPKTRPSHGLDQFFSSIAGRSGLRILDLAGASQANVTFITDLGHRVYSDDLVRTMDDVFGRDSDFVANQADPQRVEQFLDQTLNFEEGQFDGALVWDTLQFLAPPVLHLTIARLHRVLGPESSLLAFFHSEEKANVVPLYSYRIADSKTLSLTARGQRKPAQFFNNRSLEKLFNEFRTLKFFLTRDHLREVIVWR